MNATYKAYAVSDLYEAGARVWSRHPQFVCNIYQGDEEMREIIEYECEVCGRVYRDKEDAARCEAKPVQNDKAVKVGDVVRITRGSGAGQLAKVTAITVHERGWGPAIYDHSVALVADVIGSWGSRLLAFDSYEVVE